MRIIFFKYKYFSVKEGKKSNYNMNMDQLENHF